MTGPPDIDPGLHYLLPPEQRGMGLSKAEAGAQTALFNARTGRFTANNYQYTVGHLDEYNRANRMKSHYFDVDSWEKERAEENAKRKRDEEMGIAPKAKISRKDMVGHAFLLHSILRLTCRNDSRRKRQRGKRGLKRGSETSGKSEHHVQVPKKAFALDCSSMSPTSGCRRVVTINLCITSPLSLAVS